MFILTCIYEKEGVQAKQNHLSFLKKKKKKKLQNVTKIGSAMLLLWAHQ